MPLRRRDLPFVALALAGLTVLAAAACRPDRSDGRSSGRPLRIAVIPIGTTHEFWKSVHAGALAAARELGVQIVWSLSATCPPEACPISCRTTPATMLSATALRPSAGGFASAAGIGPFLAR